MKTKYILIVSCLFAVSVSDIVRAQEVVFVDVHDKAREDAEKKALEGYMTVFATVLKSQQKALNYKRRLLIDNVIITEFQREELNADMHISEDVIILMQKNMQGLSDRLIEIWEYYDKEYMGNAEIASVIKTYYEAKKKQILEDKGLIDRKVNAFIKGEGVEHTIATPRQRMEIIREVRKEYRQLCGISMKQSDIFRTLILAKTNRQEGERE